MSALERAWRYDREADERAAGRVERFELGAAVYSDDLPRVYDANVIRIDRGLGRTSADDLERLAESLQDGMGHRKLVLPGSEAGDRLAQEMGRRRWSTSRTVVMEYTGPRERDSQAAVGESVDPRVVRGARMEALTGRSTDVQAQVADFTERLGAAAGG